MTTQKIKDYADELVTLVPAKLEELLPHNLYSKKYNNLHSVKLEHYEGMRTVEEQVFLTEEKLDIMSPKDISHALALSLLGKLSNDIEAFGKIFVYYEDIVSVNYGPIAIEDENGKVSETDTPHVMLIAEVAYSKYEEPFADVSVSGPLGEVGGAK